MSEVQILLFWLFMLLAYIVFSIIVVKKLKLRYWKSLLVLIPAGFSALCTFSLWRNYKASIMPQDGIGISNMLSYAIIGEDGWTVELFRNSFQRSIIITIIGFLLFALIFILDVIFKGRNGKANSQ